MLPVPPGPGSMEWTVDELSPLPWVFPPSVAVRVDMSVRPTPDEVVREIPPVRSLQQTQTSPRQFPELHHSPLPADTLRGESLVCKREQTTPKAPRRFGLRLDV
jgi:hypothetical protein